MKFFYFMMLVVFIGMPPRMVEAKTPSTSLPPKIEAKLLKLDEKVSDLERKSFSLAQKLREINKKIFKKKFRQVRDRVVIKYLNRLNSTFRLMEATIFLRGPDGKSRKIFFAKRPDVRKSIVSKKTLLNDKLPPGNYSLKVLSRVHGYSPIFTYLNGYKLKVNNNMKFTVEAKRQLTIMVEFYDTGGFKVQERLKIRFRIAQK